MADDAPAVPGASDAPDGGDESLDPGQGQDDAGGTSADALDLDQVAAEFEAEAINEMRAAKGLPPVSKEEGQGDSGKGSPAAYSPEVKKFIDENYGGNEAAFLAAQYESRREGQSLAAKVRELELKLEAASAPKVPPRDAAADFKTAREQNPEVQALDHEAQSVAEENKALSARQLEVVSEADKISKDIAKLEGQLTLAADTDDKIRLRMEITELRTRHSQLNTEYVSNDRAYRSNQKVLGSLAREIKRLEADIRGDIEEREETEKTQREQIEATRQSFASAFDTHIKQYNVDPKSETFRFLHESARTMIADYLDSLGREGKGLDAAGMNNAVSRVLEKAAQAFNIQRKGAAPPKRRVTPRHLQLPHAGGRPPAAGSPPGAQPTPSRSPQSTTDVLKDPDMVRKRADAVFGAFARQVGRR